MASMAEAKKLIEERDKLDLYIAEQEGILKSHGVDMKTPLVDEQGYPVANVDIYTVRNARKALICAQNDRKALNERIEEMINKVHEEARASATTSSAEPKTQSISEVHRTSNAPFARIDKVFPDSPAHLAGLASGDNIVQFGSLHAENFKELKQFEPVVQNSEGTVIRVTVLREGKPYRIELVPNRWAGRGLLGCSILPLSSAKII